MGSGRECNKEKRGIGFAKIFDFKRPLRSSGGLFSNE